LQWYNADVMKKLTVFLLVIVLTLSACNNSPSDTYAPIISAILVSGVTETSPTITWSTDEPTTSQVEYGTTTSYGSSTSLSTTLKTTHAVSLTNLDSDTTYYYRVRSIDAAGNERVSASNSFDIDSADTVAPIITMVSALDITATTATITWTTDEPSTSQVEYGLTEAYGYDSSTNTLVATTNHTVNLIDLNRETTYHYRVKSIDEAGNEAISMDYTFTSADTDLIPLKVYFIDVGQGDAILIDYGSHEMLIDGGRYGDCEHFFDVHPHIIDGPLEVLVETHPDADHIGGLDDMLSEYAVTDIWLSGDESDTAAYDGFMSAANSEGATVHYAQRGDEITLGNLTLNVLNPNLPLDDNTNDNSIVLLLSFGQIDYLFTGDIENLAEVLLLVTGSIPDIEILKVSHHGSAYSSDPRFLAVAQPEEAIISVGNSNSYGHPTAETLSRLSNAGATVYRTDLNGTIVVASTDGINYTISTDEGEGIPPEESIPDNPVDDLAYIQVGDWLYSDDADPEYEGVTINVHFYDSVSEFIWFSDISLDVTVELYWNINDSPFYQTQSQISSSLIMADVAKIPFEAMPGASRSKVPIVRVVVSTANGDFEDTDSINALWFLYT
jgi:beta-lactamase superfamily II metal-dependent hydrolase/uncharacterized lipoprotein NlpE involved in copper resistance